MSDELTRRQVFTAAGAAGVAALLGSQNLEAAQDQAAKPSIYKAEPMSAKQFHATNPAPVLFQFNPVKFTVCKDPADLRQWEADLKQRVGLNIGIDINSLSESCCESGCPDTNDCDTD